MILPFPLSRDVHDGSDVVHASVMPSPTYVCIRVV